MGVFLEIYKNYLFKLMNSAFNILPIELWLYILSFSTESNCAWKLIYSIKDLKGYTTHTTFNHFRLSVKFTIPQNCLEYPKLKNARVLKKKDHKYPYGALLEYKKEVCYMYNTFDTTCKFIDDAFSCEIQTRKWCLANKQPFICHKYYSFPNNIRCGPFLELFAHCEKAFMVAPFSFAYKDLSGSSSYYHGDKIRFVPNKFSIGFITEGKNHGIELETTADSPISKTFRTKFWFLGKLCNAFTTYS